MRVSPRSQRVFLSLASGSAAILLALTTAAAAHSPHDVATLVQLSPDFAHDRTVFACFTLTEHRMLGRSRDAGRSWELYAPPMMLHGVSSLRLSPAFAVDRTLFVASVTDGVFRSTDGGDSWQPIRTGMTDLRVNDLAVSPDFGLDHALLAGTPSGCFRSSDGGETWIESNAGLTPGPITAVAIAARGVAFACGFVMHRCSSVSPNWTAVQSFPLPAETIAVSPDYEVDSTAAVCFGRYGGGIEATLDGGANWAPLVDGLTDAYVNDLAFAQDGTFFAVSKEDGCFRAPSLGEPFALLNDGFEHHSEQTGNHYLNLSVSPAYATDHTLFVAAFEGLHRSENKGHVWKQMDVYSQRVNRRVIVTRDAAGERELLVGNYGCGLQVCRVFTHHGAGAGAGAVGGGPGATLGAAGADALGGGAAAPSLAAAGSALGQPAGLDWSARADGLGALWTEVLERSPDYAQDGTLLLGHIGLWLSTDRGRSWGQLPVPPWELPIRAAAFSPQWTEDHTLFVAREQGGVFRSTDSGEHWTLLDEGLPFGDSMSFIRLSPHWPSDPVALISAKSGNVFRSGDGCGSWSSCGDLPGSEVRALELSPNFVNDRLVLVGTVGDGIYISSDAGESWLPGNVGLPTGMPLVVEGLAFSPDFATDDTAFLSLLTGGVYRSDDHARSWSLVSEDLPLSAPRVLGLSTTYAQDHTLVLATHDWAWMSQDAGVHWKQLPGFIRVNDGHPAVVYRGLWAQVAAPQVTGLADRFSVQAGAVTELEFDGETIDWFSRTGPDEGTAQVFIDDQLAATVDLKQPTSSNQVRAFSQSFATVGWHTIRVVNLGRAGRNRNTRVFTDGFAYTF